jgi:nucleoside-diphosphate-sugar epimerase
MPDETTLITGANGEIGHVLIKQLGLEHPDSIVALDIKPLDAGLEAYCREFVHGDVLDRELLRDLGSRFQFDRIFHLASILSARAERDPVAAHRVNVNGTLNMLQLSLEQAKRAGAKGRFMFPSSIAVYGFENAEAKEAAGAVDERVPCTPSTIYGANKLYCEHLGRYFSTGEPLLDFRAIRFPGLISADTVPSGGTSDYGPEMLHAAADGKSYRCFVRPDTQLPFMAMPDAIKATLELMKADTVSQRVYNVTSFSPTAAQIRDLVLEFFPGANISFEPDLGRQAIVDSWPTAADDSAAQRDWGWVPDYDLRGAFADYLVPAVTRRYQTAS